LSFQWDLIGPYLAHQDETSRSGVNRSEQSGLI
jgi:hypothetical protein